jgi:epsilon-lactone hydrolase
MKVAGVAGILLALVAVHSMSDAREDGTIHVPAFNLPHSEFLSSETRAVLMRQRRDDMAFASACPLKKKWTDIESEREVAVFRECLAKNSATLIARFRAHHQVTIEPGAIGGVKTEIFTPFEGVSDVNKSRVLINLHGGAFMWGGHTSGGAGQIESIPIAAVGKVKVVSIDYRMAPEHRFPAASEDVAIVYRALLKNYGPQNIGFYGCSAGGFLVAQAVAWFQKEGLPAPGAVGMFCAGAVPSGGDSDRLGAAITGARSSTSAVSSKSIYYLGSEQLSDPLAFPGIAPQKMAHFPDSLLISSTRDFNLSSVVVTHTRLTKVGVRAELHIWEGLGHGFLYDPDLPESREAYEVIVRFFDKHLGQR